MEKFEVGGVDYPVIGHALVKDENNVIIDTVPIVDIPQMSDYQWQLSCLKSRLEHPEYYESSENVQETIRKLRIWLEEHKEEKTA